MATLNYSQTEQFSPNRQRSTQKRKCPNDQQENPCDDYHRSEESEDETEYGFVTEDNYYSPEQLRKDVKEKMNSKEYTDAMKSLKVEMEKKCPEKFRK